MEILCVVLILLAAAGYGQIPIATTPYRCPVVESCGMLKCQARVCTPQAALLGQHGLKVFNSVASDISSMYTQLTVLIGGTQTVTDSVRVYINNTCGVGAFVSTSNWSQLAIPYTFSGSIVYPSNTSGLTCDPYGSCQDSTGYVAYFMPWLDKPPCQSGQSPGIYMVTDSGSCPTVEFRIGLNMGKDCYPTYKSRMVFSGIVQPGYRVCVKKRSASWCLWAGQTVPGDVEVISYSREYDGMSHPVSAVEDEVAYYWGVTKWIGWDFALLIAVIVILTIVLSLLMMRSYAMSMLQAGDAIRRNSFGLVYGTYFYSTHYIMLIVPAYRRWSRAAVYGSRDRFRFSRIVVFTVMFLFMYISTYGYILALAQTVGNDYNMTCFKDTLTGQAICKMTNLDRFKSLTEQGPIEASFKYTTRWLTTGSDYVPYIAPNHILMVIGQTSPCISGYQVSASSDGSGGSMLFGDNINYGAYTYNCMFLRETEPVIGINMYGPFATAELQINNMTYLLQEGTSVIVMGLEFSLPVQNNKVIKRVLMTRDKVSLYQMDQGVEALFQVVEAGEVIKQLIGNSSIGVEGRKDSDIVKDLSGVQWGIGPLDVLQSPGAQQFASDIDPRMFEYSGEVNSFTLPFYRFTNNGGELPYCTDGLSPPNMRATGCCSNCYEYPAALRHQDALSAWQPQQYNNTLCYRAFGPTGPITMQIPTCVTCPFYADVQCKNPSVPLTLDVKTTWTVNKRRMQIQGDATPTYFGDPGSVSYVENTHCMLANTGNKVAQDPDTGELMFNMNFVANSTGTAVLSCSGCDFTGMLVNCTTSSIYLGIPHDKIVSCSLTTSQGTIERSQNVSQAYSTGFKIGQMQMKNVVGSRVNHVANYTTRADSGFSLWIFKIYDWLPNKLLTAIGIYGACRRITILHPLNILSCAAEWLIWGIMVLAELAVTVIALYGLGVGILKLAMWIEMKTVEVGVEHIESGEDTKKD